MKWAAFCTVAIDACVTLAGCSAGSAIAPAAPAAYVQPTRSLASVAVSATPPPVTRRTSFLGAFFRAVGSPPYGVFEPQSSGVEPNPYPTPGAVMTGADGYCDRRAANGASITGSYVVDPTKLADIVDLGVGWTRMEVSQFQDDDSHISGPGVYNFTDLDSAQCATLVSNAIKPVIAIEPGPVEYDAVPGVWSPAEQPLYETAGDFGTWCGAVATHEKAAFGVGKFTIPGNEVNTSNLFPGGVTEIAAYTHACYAAIKAANPQSVVYGFELNMDGGVNAPGFVSQMVALGCKVGTCYDAIAMHLTLRYPIPSAGTPCYPSPGGDYSVRCIRAIQVAAGTPVHVLISESVYPVTSAVPDENTKALAVAAEFAALSPYSSVDGVSYANVDECALYPPGTWFDGCLITTTNQTLPAYTALQNIALTSFPR